MSEDFGFPFEPYDIQRQFMAQLYDVLDTGKIGIFESPTGTGKSLSLLCGAVTWLRERDARERADLSSALQTKPSMSAAPADDWIAEHRAKLEAERRDEDMRNRREYLGRVDARIAAARGRLSAKQKRKRASLPPSDGATPLADEDSDEDADLAPSTRYSSDDDECAARDDADERLAVRKVFVCSRTHSQLEQMLGELKRTRFGGVDGRLRVVTLGSRAGLCANAAVKRLGASSLINERCLELQRRPCSVKSVCTDKGAVKSKGKAGCPMYRADAIEALADELLCEVRTVKAVVRESERVGACAYYASRAALPLVEVVLLPYQVLLHAETRRAFGVQLSGNVVIVDEAHNLLDTLAAMHSADLPLAHVTAALAQLRGYCERYEKRLHATNLSYIRRLISVVAALRAFCHAESHSSTDRVVNLAQFFIQTRLENENLYKVLVYLERSQLSRKLSGFAQRYGVVEACTEQPSSLAQFLVTPQAGATKCAAATASKIAATSSMYVVQSFFSAVTSCGDDGRILIVHDVRDKETVRLRCVLLNPAMRLRELTDKCAAVVLAGGTMEPSEQLTDALLRVCGVAPERLHRFSCGHVVAATQVAVEVLCVGPAAADPLNFSFESRGKDATLRGLQCVLLNVFRLVPAGVVLFFASYDYLDVVYGYLEKSGMAAKLQAMKRVFREPKAAADVEQLLADYDRCIRQSGGAALFAVVGGKLSEGINFADDSGRCVIMVGLPYANRSSVELRERMHLLDRQVGTGAGQRYYEALCAQSINQSIGRAIRHRNDYAAVVLLDARFAERRHRQALPAWLAANVRVHDRSFAPFIAALRQFFLSNSVGSSLKH